jgi:hypothetical protein
MVALANASENALPNYGRQSYEEITARAILSDINRTSFSYDRVVIIGDLIFYNSQYNSISITNSIIKGNISCEGLTVVDDVDFENTSFLRSAQFNDTKFLGSANFNNSHFYGMARFNTSRFPDGATFDFASFNDTADFANSWFDKFGTFYNATFAKMAQFTLSEFNGAYVNFGCSQFYDNADFSGAKFGAYAAFDDATFWKIADFHGTKFNNGASFYYDRFHDTANFARSHFIEDLLFSHAYFNGSALFLNAKFDGPAFFNESTIRGNAIFDNAQFTAPADLSSTGFEGDLSMNSTKITKMVLDDSVFGESSRIFLGKADINRLMVSWSLIRDKLVFDASAYPSLVKNYKDLGQSNDANDCYYEYRYLNQAHKPIGVSKFLDVVAWLSCGYGVRPHYALLCGVVVILIFALILRAGKGVEGFTELHGWQLFLSSLYFSTIAFTANSKGLPLKGHYKYLGIAEGIVGWLLMALFLVTLGRLIIG